MAGRIVLGTQDLRDCNPVQPMLPVNVLPLVNLQTIPGGRGQGRRHGDGEHGGTASGGMKHREQIGIAQMQRLMNKFGAALREGDDHAGSIAECVERVHRETERVSRFTLQGRDGNCLVADFAGARNQRGELAFAGPDGTYGKGGCSYRDAPEPGFR